MPRVPTSRTTQRQRPAPYETRSASHSMAAPLVSSYAQQFSPWDHSSYDQPHMMPMFMHSMPLEPSLSGPHGLPTQSSNQRHLPKNSQSAPWTAEEDECLRESKRKGLQWEVIHKQYFPGKSGNACRKRYERLEIKRRSTEWDPARLERLAVAYKEMRPTIWEPLARRLGERWEHVEKQVSKPFHPLPSESY
jgi:Myb-like DNA-binding domain